MIVLYKDNKIIGADKELLDSLNVDLYNLSNKISELDLLIASYQNKPFSIDNFSFIVKEIPFISLENIKIFTLEEASQTAKELNLNMPLEEKISIFEEPQFEEPQISLEPQVSIEQQISMEPQISTNLQIPIEETFNEPLVQTPETTLPQEKEIAPITSEEEIQISFESNHSEVDEILSLNKEEANKLIADELHKAAEDLGIDYKTIYDLYIDLLKQFKDEKKAFYNAIEKEDYNSLHKIAHKLKGAALNLRLSKLALILKYIDEESKAKKPITEIKFLVDKFYDFVNKIDKGDSIKEIPESIKNLILLTIQNYLTTQNEKKFKKDLKYIEKILNIKINSLEDLQDLIKDQ